MPDERFPVEVSQVECRQIARSLELMAELLECCDPCEECNPDGLRHLSARFGNADAIRNLERMLEMRQPPGELGRAARGE